MLTSYAVGLVAISVLLAAWLAVQQGWRRIFDGDSPDADALAGRLGCHGCGVRDCDERRPPGSAPTAEEDWQ